MQPPPIASNPGFSSRILSCSFGSNQCKTKSGTKSLDLNHPSPVRKWQIWLCTKMAERRRDVMWNRSIRACKVLPRGPAWIGCSESPGVKVFILRLGELRPCLLGGDCLLDVNLPGLKLISQGEWFQKLTSYFRRCNVGVVDSRRGLTQILFNK